MAEGNLVATLRTLCESDIQFILVGGLAAVLNGAHIVRVHAVAEMVQVVRVAEEIRRNG